MSPDWELKLAKAHCVDGSETQERVERTDVLSEADRTKYSESALRGSLSLTGVVEFVDLRQRGLVDSLYGRELGPSYVQQFPDSVFPGHEWRLGHWRGFVQILNCGGAGDGVYQVVRRAHGGCGTRKQEGNRNSLTIQPI
jgi:hypothetical protein